MLLRPSLCKRQAYDLSPGTALQCFLHRTGFANAAACRVRSLRASAVAQCRAMFKLGNTECCHCCSIRKHLALPPQQRHLVIPQLECGLALHGDGERHCARHRPPWLRSSNSLILPCMRGGGGRRGGGEYAATLSSCLRLQPLTAPR